MLKKRAVLLPFAVFAAGCIFLSVRLFFIQVWDHDILSKKVDSLSVRERPEIPQRGRILDVDGHVLALNSRVYTFFADPKLGAKLRTIERGLRRARIVLPKTPSSGIPNHPSCRY